MDGLRFDPWRHRRHGEWVDLREWVAPPNTLVVAVWNWRAVVWKVVRAYGLPRYQATFRSPFYEHVYIENFPFLAGDETGETGDGAFYNL